MRLGMDRSSWVIEPLTLPADLETILEIELASFVNPWTREMYLAELENHGVSFCYVVRDSSQQVVGYCSFWRVLDELHINNLAVAPSQRGRGAGTTLLHEVLREGTRLGARRATLEVRRSNEAARRLYERLGFSVAGVRQAYYTHPVEDALILWREDISHD
jgi:[ribosomal protein S18]-alanine N-acetyltransferase